jgi:hypothetical protein
VHVSITSEGLAPFTFGCLICQFARPGSGHNPLAVPQCKCTHVHPLPLTISRSNESSSSVHTAPSPVSRTAQPGHSTSQCTTLSWCNSTRECYVHTFDYHVRTVLASGSLKLMMVSLLPVVRYSSHSVHPSIAQSRMPHYPSLQYISQRGDFWRLHGNQHPYFQDGAAIVPSIPLASKSGIPRFQFRVALAFTMIIEKA